MMQKPIQLIVGLGNPGLEYKDTRHNLGFSCVHEILNKVNAPELRLEKKFQGFFTKLNSAETVAYFLLPQTFMNASGISVQAAAHFYKILPESILVIHDDLDLEAGIARLKIGGGDGGHNGLKDIIRHLGTRDFARLRLGVGRPRNRESVVSYVLKKPRSEEQTLIDQAIDRAIDVFPELLKGNLNKAMQELHTKRN